MSDPIDWKQVHQKTQEQPWATELLNNLDEGFRAHLGAAPAEPPLAESSWYHFYFCGTCAKELRFDFASPEQHVCPDCHKVYTGEPWDGSWRLRVHSAILHNLERAALLIRLRPEQPTARDYFRRTIQFYAAHYSDYAVHGKQAGKGKIMAQCLDEAIFFIGLARYLDWVGAEVFTPGELAEIGRQLFEPAVDLIKPQIGCIHNIHAWMQAMMAAAGAFLRDQELIRFAVDSEFGWRKQLESGVRDDGFWFEGSITYHYYSFGAFASLARSLSADRPELMAEPRLRAMLDAPLGLAYPNGEFPAHNDCWKGTHLITNAPYYELGTGLGIRDYRHELAWIYEGGKPRDIAPTIETPNPVPTPAIHSPRSSVHALLFGPAELPKPELPRSPNRIFGPSGIAILENNQARVCLRFHPDSGGHDHRDKLAVDVFAHHRMWSADLGTSGYGAAITNQWYKTAPAHNLVVVDQMPAAHSSGQLKQWDPAGKISAEANEAYPGIRQGRTIQWFADGWQDDYHVAAEATHTYDWCFHGEGRIEGDLAWQPAPAWVEVAGYDQLTDIEAAETAQSWSVRWVDAIGGVHLDFVGAPGTQIFRARCPGNPANPNLGFLMVRRQTNSTVFSARFSVSG